MDNNKKNNPQRQQQPNQPSQQPNKYQQPNTRTPGQPQEKKPGSNW